MNFLFRTYLFIVFISVSCTNQSSINNTLLIPWTGPFNGVPAFDKVKLSDVKNGMLDAMQKNLVEIEVIASNQTPPTFKNTIEAIVV